MGEKKGFEVVNMHGTASGIIPVPVIGENGNWFIGNDDTGINAQGPKGQDADVVEMEKLKHELAMLRSSFSDLATVQYGEVTVNITAVDQTTQFMVTFPKEFASPPKVTISLSTTIPKQNNVSIHSVSSKGFTGYLYRNADPTHVLLNWIAVGK